MKVKSISAVNFKGRTFVEGLAPVTLFHGANFAGKSARVEALTLALAGFLPGVGKAPRDLFDRLASGNPMRVELECDDRAKMWKQWQEQKGSVKYTDNSANVFMPPMPSVSVDAGEFLGLSEVERVKFLFARAKLPEEFTVNKLANTIAANVKNIKLEDNTPQTEEVVREIAEFIWKGVGIIPPTPQDWMTTLASGLRDKKLVADQNVKRQQQTQQGLAQNAAASIANPTAEYDKAEADRVFSEASAAATKAQLDLEMTQSELARTEAAAAFAAGEDDIRKEIADLEMERSKLLILVPVDASPAERALREAERSVTNARVAMTAAKAETERIENEIAKVQKLDKCPTCGQSMEGHRKKAVADLRESHKVNKHKVDLLVVAFNEAQESLRSKDDAFQSVYKQHIEQSGVMSRRAAISEQIEARLKSLSKCAAAHEARSRVNGLVEDCRLKREKLDDAQFVASKAKESADTAAREFSLLVAHRAAKKQSADAQVAGARAKAEAEVLKAAVAIVGELQAKLVDAAVGPLIAKANELCLPVLKTPLAWRDGEIGMDGGAVFFTWRTFSGTQKALAFAAISVALATDAPLRLVIIDEVGRLDYQNKVLLTLHLCELESAGKIDQAVIVDTAIAACRADNFKCVEVKG